ncbi:MULTISPECIES: hypothetical protein [unclassified Duganella]|jgi:hypothetical protein|uniref:hypothetical protein n=1 Tax=unclassified Duganella TaxID=2636909 RepID=UPI0008810192|nr:MULTISPECIES: hypothetical protein [unclassified Duganella]SDH17813.1 hypothetical protein SAMN05216320_110165 [Duganella sp. OV458]SDK32318.1 hypothetical protein SAMN05428973_110166 [Duganella sp. OV510]
MKLHDIDSSRLPEIADSVKECINMGEWLLFKTESQDSAGEAAFFLKTPTSVFKLSDRGGVLHEVDDGFDRLEIDELFYFSDVSKPVSLSNIRPR